jgi:hypothetical protein
MVRNLLRNKIRKREQYDIHWTSRDIFPTGTSEMEQQAPLSGLSRHELRAAGIGLEISIRIDPMTAFGKPGNRKFV